MFAEYFYYAACLIAVNAEIIYGNEGRYIEEENRDRNGDGVNSLSETIPGEADADYPTYTQIPKTAFSCEGRANWAYYADIETGCQVFHVCDSQFSKLSFVCPIGSVFNQALLICDWWYKTECGVDGTETETAGNGDDFNNQGGPFVGRDQDRFDLNIAASSAAAGGAAGRGGNSIPYSNTNTLDQKILSGSRKQFPPPAERDQFRTRRYVHFRQNYF